MSAPRASETPSIATSPRDVAASLRTVQVPASPATYANRAALQAIGLRWDPEGHQWHGTTTADRVRERLGLEVRVFGTLEHPRGPKPPRPPVRVAPRGTAEDPDPVRRVRDGSRTHLESRIAFPGSDEEADEIATPTRRFLLSEITSDLPDDSREADERAAERRLRELRARVKAARAVVSTTPGLTEALARRGQKAAVFLARFEITYEQLRWGVPYCE